MKRVLLVLAGLSRLFGTAPALAANAPQRELRDGDRIVLIGDALIERDQTYGYLETLLTSHNPGKSLVFRNLGWSGDTVFGDARAGFGTAVDGFQQLKAHVLALKPTVIVVGYGMSDSFAGDAGLRPFATGLAGLLDVFAQTRARTILLSPLGHEDLGRPLPDPSTHDRVLASYGETIREAADVRGLGFIDLYHLDAIQGHGRPPRPESPPLTDDGIHLTRAGSWAVAAAIASKISRVSARDWIVAIAAEGTIKKSVGANLSRVQATPRGLRFEVRDEHLPPSPPPLGSIAPDRLPLAVRRLKVSGLPRGRYALKIDGTSIRSADADQWSDVTLSAGPEFDQVERLRRTINEKNLLYFYRWRPQNETYLFGFRKHEQGNNAREIPLFDPLVEAKEREIATLKVPVSHVYELIRESDRAQ